MKQYLDLMRHVRDNGTRKEDRTGTGTISVFGYQMRFDLADGFPLVTTKKVHLRSIIHELLWFLKGDTNIRYLHDNKVTIWDEWADENGDLGPVYGSQWRSWPGADGRHIDQVSQVIDQIRNNPDSRRIIVSAWNVGEIDNMALPPCHAFFQFYVANIIETITRSLADAGLSPQDIDCINAHGTSTPENDKMEYLALSSVLGSHLIDTPISSNKSMIGHTLSAAGTIEAAISLLTLNAGVIPPTINCHEQDPTILMDVVPLTKREKPINTIMSNSFGFGGQNVSLIFSNESA